MMHSSQAVHIIVNKTNKISSPLGAYNLWRENKAINSKLSKNQMVTNVREKNEDGKEARAATSNHVVRQGLTGRWHWNNIWQFMVLRHHTIRKLRYIAPDLVRLLVLLKTVPFGRILLCLVRQIGYVFTPSTQKTEIMCHKRHTADRWALNTKDFAGVLILHGVLCALCVFKLEVMGLSINISFQFIGTVFTYLLFIRISWNYAHSDPAGRSVALMLEKVCDTVILHKMSRFLTAIKEIKLNVCMQTHFPELLLICNMKKLPTVKSIHSEWKFWAACHSRSIFSWCPWLIEFCMSGVHWPVFSIIFKYHHLHHR